MQIPSDAAWPPLVHSSQALTSARICDTASCSIEMLVIMSPDLHEWSAPHCMILLLARYAASYSCPSCTGEDFMTLFDDQPSARDVRKQRQARFGEEAQHASSAAPGRPCSAAATECSPSTPEQWMQETDELGFTATKGELGGHGSSRYSQQCSPSCARPWGQS